MKPTLIVLSSLTAVALACTHEPPPRTAQAPSTSATQTALVGTAEPGPTPIPTNAPAIPAPVAPPPVVTTASLAQSPLVAAPPPSALPAVPHDPALDKVETDADAESVHEIRALLAADKSLSTTARQVTITARSGKVKLSGQVNTAAERASVERAARRAANVTNVQNDLVVLQ